MNASDVQAWLDAYVAAWRANDRGPIEALFTEDAEYRFHPWDEGDDVIRGRDAIAASWLEHQDDPASWDARYEPFAVEGDRAVAVGTSHYQARGEEPEQTYHNAYLLEFAPDGRCRSFTEFFMLARGAAPDAG
jgi:ketosteroid isomerase-like protein